MYSNTVHYVIYNGIQLNLTKIDSFDSQTETDPGAVDRIYNHVTLRVTGIANGQINQNGLSNSALLTFLRQSLQEPRRPLAVIINGQSTINVQGSDAKNGPIPRDVKVYNCIGATIMVEFSIEYWESPCTSSGLIVLTNRWKQRDDIDENAMTTLTSSGRIVVDASKTAGIADDYRGLPVPVATIPNGFVRQSQSYEISEDGTTMEWTVVDQEVLIPPPTYNGTGDVPLPITKWDGDYKEGSSLQQGAGAVITATLNVKAWGAKWVPKNALILFCVRVFQSRWNKEQDIITDYSFVEGLSENSVSLSVSLITFSQKDYEGTKFQVTTRIGSQLDIYDEGQPTSKIPDRGSAGLWLAIKDIVATCASKQTNVVVTSNTVNQTPTAYGDVRPTGTLAIDTEDNDVEQDKYPYTISHIESQVVEDQCLIQCPVAGQEVTTPSFFARMAAPVSKQIVRFDFQRLNASPKLPKPELENRTLMQIVMDPSDVLLLPSGVDRLYRIRGQYIFGYQQTAQIGYTPFIMPSAITDSQGIADNNSIGESSFVTGLIG